MRYRYTRNGKPIHKCPSCDHAWDSPAEGVTVTLRIARSHIDLPTFQFVDFQTFLLRDGHLADSEDGVIAKGFFDSTKCAGCHTALKDLVHEKLIDTYRGVRRTLLEFVEDINAAGGVVVVGPSHGPAACPDWTDLGDIYMKACLALGRTPVLEKSDDDESSEEGGA